jgi:hypothetical protein
MSGKGSSPRPFSVSQEEFANNFDRIFSKKKQDSVESVVTEDGDIDIDKELEEVDNNVGLG